MDNLSLSEKIKDVKKIISFSNITIFILILLIFFLDRFTKNKIIDLQLQNTNTIFINEYVNFDLIWNRDAWNGTITNFCKFHAS